MDQDAKFSPHLWWSNQRFFACKWQHHKDVNTCTTLNTHFVSICDPRCQKNDLTKNITFGNCASLTHHQTRGSSHVIMNMGNIVNKNKSLITSAHEDSSIDVPTPNMLMSFSLNFSLSRSFNLTFLGNRVATTKCVHVSQVISLDFEWIH